MARKKLVPITAKKNANSRIKPKYSRKLINSFHVLLKARRQLINKFNIEGINEQNFLQMFETSYPKVYELYKSYYELHAGSKSSKKQPNERKNDLFHTIEKMGSLSIRQFDADFKDGLKLLSEIEYTMELQGGLQTYQASSLSGQDEKRGGDSSKKLMMWLDELFQFDPTTKLNALEVGSLSSKNKISTSKWFKENVTRIDLNSQEPQLILQQDFMKRPLPVSEKDRFNLISLSLVLNFVPTALERGDMLKKLSFYFKKNNFKSKNPSSDPANSSITSYEKDAMPPCLFFVLPLPCVTNSKYICKENLLNLLKDLGYEPLKYQESNKLVYMLLKYDSRKLKKTIQFRKKQIFKDRSRNNFSIILSK